MRIRLLSGLLLSAAAAMACQNYPTSFVPFTKIAYVSAPNSAGDRLVVGELTGDGSGILAIGNNLPLPGAANETYCNAQVQLGPNNSYLNVYVPSTAERSGNFSPFAGLLLDPAANNQPFPNGIIPISRLGGVYAFRIGSQTASPSQCSGSSVPNVIRLDGRAELVSDYLITCTGGVPTPAQQTVPQVNVTVTLNGTITSRQLAAPNWSEVLLLVDDPPTGSQFVCAAANGICSVSGTGLGTSNGPAQSPNIFQGQQTQPNVVTFTGIPLNPPGPTGSRTFRITNVKVDAQALGLGSLEGPGSVAMMVMLTAPTGVSPLSTQTVAYVQKALTVTSKAPQSGPSGLTQFTLNYAEQFSNAFKVRSGTLFLNPDLSPAPTNQDAPGQSVPGSETGFYSGVFPFLATRGNLGVAGLADNGTRFYAQLSNVPAGVNVSTNAVTNLVAGSASTGTVRLITASPSTGGAFNALGTPAAPVSLARDSAGTVTAVFEVLSNDPLRMESVDIPFFFSYSSGAPSLNSLSLTAGLAPVTSNNAAPFPRFTSATTITVTASNPSSPLQVVPQQIQFTAVQGGNTPGPQSIAITVAGTAQSFSTQIDGGTTGTAAAWLNVQPSGGSTPATLVVTVNPTGLAAGTYNGRIRITPQGSQSPVDVSVTLTITAAPPQLSVAPLRLQFSATFGGSGVQEQGLLVRNTGGGSVSFAATVVGKSTWIKDVTPASGQTVPNAPVILRVHANAQALAVGTYTDFIRFTWAGATTDIPVVLSVRAAGSVLKLGTTGVKFEVRQGNGTSNITNVSVINAGDPGTTVNFAATLLSGSDWATLTVLKNQATTNSPGLLTLAANANVATFPAGGRTALVQIIDPNSQNSPQFVTAVLQVDPVTTFAPPDPVPAGVFLVATAGAAQPTAPVVLNYSSTNTVPYLTSIATVNATNGLAVFPPAGQVSTAAPGHLTLSGNGTALQTGIYSGTASIYIGSGLRTVHATLVVVPGAGTGASPGTRGATGCTPQQMVLVQTKLADNYLELVGFPSSLIVQVNDDCGNPVPDASVVASFNNGDAPLRLEGDNTGFYSATWIPGHVFPGMTITFDATNPTLLSPSTPTGPSSVASRGKLDGAVNLAAAGARLTGSVAANPNLPPVISVGGTVNNSNPVASAPLAPGTISSVYGNQLATVTQQTPGLPLPTQFQGTDIRVGNFRAPLFYVSPTQVNIQIPFELAPNQSYPVVATVNGVSSVLDTISVAPATPAVIAFPDGTAKAQHADASFATAANPAKPGEAMAIYLVGMGATTPAVASGAGAPFNPHPLVNSPPTLIIDGVPAAMQFPGGLVGGSVGLYQINFTVPVGARTGALDLVVTQNGFTANVTKLIVGR